MSNPGRNEPCHCGSGKKYKKCCLEKDAAAAIVALAPKKMQVVEAWEPEADERMHLKNNEADREYDEMDEEGNGDDENVVDGMEEEEEEDDENVNEGDLDEIEEEGLENIHDKGKSLTNKDYPVISEADEKLVDEWWDGLDYDKEAVEIKKYIEGFIHAHPQLVENLGLEQEVLFELGRKYRVADNGDEYIHFLFYMRKEFPGAYGRSGGYFDSDIIAWLIANKREDEIENYLGYFKEYPIDFIDELFDVVRLLEATDNIEPLISLASATLERITTSHELFGGDKILFPLISQTMSKYLDKGIANIDIAGFMNELSKVLAPFNVDKTDETLNYWKATFDSILRPFTNWPVDIPKKKSQIENRYMNIGDNFSRFLHEQTGISWVSARYYSAQIDRYFMEYIRLANGKIKKQFDFSENKIDKIVGLASKKIIWLDCTKSISMLQAIYHFAAYLQECGNATEQEKLTIQQDCTNLYNIAFPSLKKEFAEADCFKAFPFL